ncbi:MAG: GNAT family N-acetyltransferase [Nitrospiraceae bacterium]
MKNIDSMPNVKGLHVLMVSNHWEDKKQCPAAGVFVDRQVDSLRRAGVKISTFDVGTSHSPFHILNKWLQLRRTVRELRPDLIHGQYGTIVGFLSVFAGRPAVISLCGGDLLPGAPSVPLPRMCAGFLLSNLAALRARGLICKSEELRQALWWRRNQAVVIPSGVDLNLFSPGSQQAARKELGWEISSPVAFFSAGGDQKNKGLDVVKAAMKVVRSRLPDTLLHIISHDVEPNRMPLYYRAADVLVCASRLEGSPNVVKEALACNLPVVSTPVGDVPERLAGVQPSAVIARDAKAIGEALVQVLLERKRSNGREHVASLSLENIAQRVLNVYRTALRDSLDDNPAVGKPRGEELTVVTITDGDMLQEVAGLHLDAFAGYLNTLLGRGYAKAFIKWFIKSERTIAIAAINSNKKIVGYALGAPVGYDRGLNRALFWGVAARIIIRPWLLFNPRLWTVITARARSLMGLRQIARQVFELPEPSMSLVAIGVGSSQRRSKIGQRLMRTFEAEARECQMRSLVLSVYENGTAARRFYEKCGWQPYSGQASKGGVIRYFKILQSDQPGEVSLSKTIECVV